MEKKEIELLASIARLNAEVAGMVAENKIREHRGEALAYPEKCFTDAIQENGLTYNAVVEKLYH